MEVNNKIAYFLDLCLGTNIPGLIMSNPGMGKTSTVEKYCEVHNYNLVTVVASQYSPDDILGLQSMQGGKLVRLTPAWFDHLMSLQSDPKNGTILFLDEITTCDEFLQAPLLNLIFNKSLGIHKLPDTVKIISAGNYESNLNGAFHMTAPLVNRFLILNLTAKDVNIHELINMKNIMIDYQDKILHDYDDIQFLKLIEDALKSANFSKATYINDEEHGLVGFQSVRSIHYALRAFQWATLNKMTEYLFKIISDTLGPYADEKYFLPLFQKAYINSCMANGHVRGFSGNGISTMSIGQLSTYINELIHYPDNITDSIYRNIMKRAADINPSLLERFNKVVDEYYW